MPSRGFGASPCIAPEEDVEWLCTAALKQTIPRHLSRSLSAASVCAKDSSVELFLLGSSSSRGSETHLRPADQTGFYVDIADTASSYFVYWTDLLALLMTPETTAPLPADHPVLRMTAAGSAGSPDSSGDVARPSSNPASNEAPANDVPSFSPLNLNSARTPMAWRPVPLAPQHHYPPAAPFQHHAYQPAATPRVWEEPMQPAVSYGRMREDFYPSFSTFTQEALRNDRALKQDRALQEGNSFVAPSQLHDAKHYTELQRAFLPTSPPYYDVPYAHPHTSYPPAYPHPQGGDSGRASPVEWRNYQFVALPSSHSPSTPGAPQLYSTPRFASPPQHYRQLPIVLGPGPSSSTSSREGSVRYHRPDSVASSRSSASSSRHETRQAARPYPVIPLHTSRSDGSTSGAPRRSASGPQPRGQASAAESAVRSAPAVLSTNESPGRPTNTRDETYAWQHDNARLLKIPPGINPQDALRADSIFAGCELISFPAGSYYTYQVRGHTVSPADAQHLNDLLRMQGCVEGCRFRTDKKRPATIRNHFINCKWRPQLLRNDPLRRLCELINERTHYYSSDRPVHRRRQRATNDESDEDMERMPTRSRNGASRDVEDRCEFAPPQYGEYEGTGSDDWSDASSWSDDNPEPTMTIGRRGALSESHAPEPFYPIPGPSSAPSPAAAPAGSWMSSYGLAPVSSLGALSSHGLPSSAPSSHASTPLPDEPSSVSQQRQPLGAFGDASTAADQPDAL